MALRANDLTDLGRPRAVVLLLLLAGCGGHTEHEPLLVVAASSLTETFLDLERSFEQAHPGVDVQISFAGSQTLATQIRQGMRADVYASANARYTDALHEEGLVEKPRAFAHNALVLVVPEGAPDLDLAHLDQAQRLVVGTDEVPIGAYTRSLLDAAQARFGDDWRTSVEARVVSREPNVRLVVTKVALGEADAAIVYATDTAVGGVRAVPLPTDLAPRTTYFLARLVDAPHPGPAQDWLDYVTSEAARPRLVAHGLIVEDLPR